MQKKHVPFWKSIQKSFFGCFVMFWTPDQSRCHSLGYKQKHFYQQEISEVQQRHFTCDFLSISAWETAPDFTTKFRGHSLQTFQKWHSKSWLWSSFIPLYATSFSHSLTHTYWTFKQKHLFCLLFLQNDCLTIREQAAFAKKTSEKLWWEGNNSVLFLFYSLLTLKFTSQNRHKA